MSRLPTRPTGGHPVPVVMAAAFQGSECHVDWGDTTTRLPVADWRRTADASDRAVLAHCVGDTVDLGCGPGRMAEHLLTQGHTVLAVDLVPEALSQATRRGVPVWLGSVLDPLPQEGEWDTALLADGNIGIAGDPVALLSRIRVLLRPGGRVVVDLGPPGAGVRTQSVRISTLEHSSRSFPWTTVSADAIELLALEAGFTCVDVRNDGERWFAVLGGGT